MINGFYIFYSSNNNVSIEATVDEQAKKTITIIDNNKLDLDKTKQSYLIPDTTISKLKEQQQGISGIQNNFNPKSSINTIDKKSKTTISSISNRFSPLISETNKNSDEYKNGSLIILNNTSNIPTSNLSSLNDQARSLLTKDNLVFIGEKDSEITDKMALLNSSLSSILPGEFSQLLASFSDNFGTYQIHNSKMISDFYGNIGDSQSQVGILYGDITIDSQGFNDSLGQIKTSLSSILDSINKYNTDISNLFTQIFNENYPVLLGLYNQILFSYNSIIQTIDQNQKQQLFQTMQQDLSSYIDQLKLIFNLINDNISVIMSQFSINDDTRKISNNCSNINGFLDDMNYYLNELKSIIKQLTDKSSSIVFPSIPQSNFSSNIMNLKKSLDSTSTDATTIDDRITLLYGKFKLLSADKLPSPSFLSDLSLLQINIKNEINTYQNSIDKSSNNMFSSLSDIGNKFNSDNLSLFSSFSLDIKDLQSGFDVSDIQSQINDIKENSNNVKKNIDDSLSGISQQLSSQSSNNGDGILLELSNQKESNSVFLTKNIIVLSGMPQSTSNIYGDVFDSPEKRLVNFDIKDTSDTSVLTTEWINSESQFISDMGDINSPVNNIDFSLYSGIKPTKFYTLNLTNYIRSFGNLLIIIGLCLLVMSYGYGLLSFSELKSIFIVYFVSSAIVLIILCMVDCILCSTISNNQRIMFLYLFQKNILLYLNNPNVKLKIETKINNLISNLTSNTGSIKLFNDFKTRNITLIDKFYNFLQNLIANNSNGNQNNSITDVISALNNSLLQLTGNFKDIEKTLSDSIDITSTDIKSSKNTIYLFNLKASGINSNNNTDIKSLYSQNKSIYDKNTDLLNDSLKNLLPFDPYRSIFISLDNKISFFLPGNTINNDTIKSMLNGNVFGLPGTTPFVINNKLLYPINTTKTFDQFSYDDKNNFVMQISNFYIIFNQNSNTLLLLQITNGIVETAYFLNNNIGFNYPALEFVESNKIFGKLVKYSVNNGIITEKPTEDDLFNKSTNRTISNFNKLNINNNELMQSIFCFSFFADDKISQNLQFLTDDGTKLELSPINGTDKNSFILVIKLDFNNYLIITLNTTVVTLNYFTRLNGVMIPKIPAININF